MSICTKVNPEALSKEKKIRLIPPLVVSDVLAPNKPSTPQRRTEKLTGRLHTRTLNGQRKATELETTRNPEEVIGRSVNIPQSN